MIKHKAIRALLFLLVSFFAANVYIWAGTEQETFDKIKAQILKNEGCYPVERCLKRP